MQLHRLAIENVGVFRGRHEITLRPQRDVDSTRHVTLITGHNGSGKTTLFNALALALHGSLSISDRLSQQQYNAYLLQRLHRHGGAEGIGLADHALLELELEYVQSGVPHQIELQRKFTRRGTVVQEDLSVSVDGVSPDVPPSDFQAWMNDVVPVGFQSAMFFDAERLDTLANPESHLRALRELLYRMLGLDLVERLQSDLELHIARHGGGKIERLRNSVRHLQAEADTLDAGLAHRRLEVAELDEQIVQLRASLSEAERLLVSEGGTYAARRPELIDRLAEVDVEIESVSTHVRDLFAHLVPFALATDLCMCLRARLNREADTQRYQVAEELLKERATRLRAHLVSGDLWQGLAIPSEDRVELERRLTETLDLETWLVNDRHEPLVHRLSESDREHMQSWIDAATAEAPQELRLVGSRLNQLWAEKRRIDEELRRAPGEDVLAAMHAQIQQISAAIVEAERARKSRQERLSSLQFQYDDKLRLLHAAADELASAERAEERVSLAHRSRLALRAFQDALAQQKVGALESTLVQHFNALCHKERLIERATIRLDDLGVELHGNHGKSVALADLSAGERQLYALALLWALRDVSGRSLPLAVDTPLARLDPRHRVRFLRDYVSRVSDQVVLFATSAEADNELFAEGTPYLAQVFCLNYDRLLESTTITSVERKCELNERVSSLVEAGG